MFDFANLKKIRSLAKATSEPKFTFKALDCATLRDVATSKKNKKLMARAATLTTQCRYCLEAHRMAATAVGVGKQEAAEVVIIAPAPHSGGSDSRNPPDFRLISVRNRHRALHARNREGQWFEIL